MREQPRTEYERILFSIFIFLAHLDVTLLVHTMIPYHVNLGNFPFFGFNNNEQKNPRILIRFFLFFSRSFMAEKKPFSCAFSSLLYLSLKPTRYNSKFLLRTFMTCSKAEAIKNLCVWNLIFARARRKLQSFISWARGQCTSFFDNKWNLRAHTHTHTLTHPLKFFGDKTLF